MDEFQITRDAMINRLRVHYGIADERVLEVMRRVPRHFFVPDALKAQAYRDNALPIPGSQTISQPYIVARMTELLEISPAGRVLEIGAGSGYQTAILASLARIVYAVERVEALAANARVRLGRLGFGNFQLICADGTIGWQEKGPFDAILVAAGGPVVPEPLLDQLAAGGRLVIPVGANTRSQKLIRVTREPRRFVREEFGACSFVPLIGEHGWQN
jgi:protein-L-isoaspartate(D-aspartate) O-methyltransferase